MKKIKFISSILIVIITATSCSDPIDDYDIDQNVTSQQQKSISSSVKYFHNSKFRGFNISPWDQNSELDEIVRQTRANILRLSFTGGVKLMAKVATNGSSTDPTADYQFDQNAFNQLNRILDWAKARGDVKILIDPHTFPGFSDDFTTGSNDLFWRDIRWRNHLYKLWDRIIDEVGHRGSEIAGYDLLNEPYIPDPEICQYGNQWNTIVSQLVQRIRSKGDHHPIIIQPAGISKGRNCNGTIVGVPQEISGWRGISHLAIPNDENLVVSSHFYVPHDFTHQGIGMFGTPGSARYPGIINGEYWNKNRMSTELQYLRNFSGLNPNTPILIGEFSVSRAAGPSGDHFLDDFLEMAETEGWHWTYHGWGGLEWNPAMHYTLPLSNHAHTSGYSPNTAPRLSLLRQHMYKNNATFPPEDKMIHGLYRLHNPNSGDVLLTYYIPEVNSAYSDYGYRIEGIVGRVANWINPNVSPFHRLRHPETHNRFYTANYNEVIYSINSLGYIYEDVVFYAVTTIPPLQLNTQYIPVYRFLKGPYHRYAFGSAERNSYIQQGWNLELNGQPAFYCRYSNMTNNLIILDP